MAKNRKCRSHNKIGCSTCTTRARSREYASYDDNTAMDMLFFTTVYTSGYDSSDSGSSYSSYDSGSSSYDSGSSYGGGDSGGGGGGCD